MPVDEIIRKIEEQNLIISNAQKIQHELFEELKNANSQSWDLVRISEASKKSGLSVTTIYRLINSGKLKCVHKGSLKYISSSELENLDCKDER